jgi:ABC-2 type transport system ATP-binding protein
MRQLIGYLPQQFSFYGNLTAEESLEHVAYLKNINKQQISDEVEHAISEVNLEDKAKSCVSTLSGGMLRRLGIAQAIIGSPQMLIVDEPTAGLDPEERVRFRNILSEICLNRTVLISTHIVEDIESACNEIVFLNHGSIIKTDSYKNILNELHGKIWELKSEKAIKSNDKFRVLSEARDENGFVCRVYSDNKPENSTFINPSLEDAYLYYVGALNDEK